jgi:hypothetical protein
MTDANEHQAFFLPFFLTELQPDRFTPFLREILAEDDLKHCYNSIFIDGVLLDLCIGKHQTRRKSPKILNSFPWKSL